MKQYVMDNGIAELAQAFDGNTVDAAKLVHLIEKAKPPRPHCNPAEQPKRRDGNEA